MYGPIITCHIVKRKCGLQALDLVLGREMILGWVNEFLSWNILMGLQMPTHYLAMFTSLNVLNSMNNSILVQSHAILDLAFSGAEEDLGSDFLFPFFPSDLGLDNKDRGLNRLILLE
ncbi:hypothetical protein ACJX0J_012267 [Zea mays]